MKKNQGGEAMAIVRVLVSQFRGPSFTICFDEDTPVDEILHLLEHASKTAKDLFFIEPTPLPEKVKEKLKIIRRGCFNNYLSLLIEEALEDLEIDKKLSESPIQQVSSN